MTTDPIFIPDILQDNNPVTAITDWKHHYRAAAICALLVVMIGFLDIGLSMTNSEAQENSLINIVQWFALFQSNTFEAFRLLGLFNMINLLLAVPLNLSLQHLHKQTQPALSTLSMILFSIGTAVYLSSNSAFSLFAISRQYAAAFGAQKTALELIGQTTLALGADLTPGTFLGFILPEIAGILMAFVLLRGGLFSKITAWLGILGLGVLLIFNTMVAFTPQYFSLAMMVAMPGGLLSMAYYIMLSHRLLQLAKR
jgi:hypothetical protein